MAAFFPKLPGELRSMIWEIAATNDHKGRLVECAWIAIPSYRKATRRVNTGRPNQLAGLHWEYRLRCYNPLPTLSVSAESRAETIRHNPNYLQLNRGAKIYFNAEKDSIYFDMRDSFFMYKYCERMMHLMGRLNVHGFDEILNLARPRPANYFCFQGLIEKPRVGPLMPNVETVVHVHLAHRMTAPGPVDTWIWNECHRVRRTMTLWSQIRVVDEEELILSRQTAIALRTVAG